MTCMIILYIYIYSIYYILIGLCIAKEILESRDFRYFSKAVLLDNNNNNNNN